jgi:thioredoxin
MRFSRFVILTGNFSVDKTWWSVKVSIVLGFPTCKQVGPILEEIASDDQINITIAKINIDENPRTPTNYGVRSIPTLMLFSDGELKDTKVGALPRQELKDWIKENS